MKFITTTAALAALIAAPASAQEQRDPDLTPPPGAEQVPAPAVAPVQTPPPPAAAPSGGYEQKDVISAAEGVFGKGAEGAAKLIEKAFKDMGKPNAYIAGREVSVALVAGLRYGSGQLYHSVEGNSQVHWTGPSIGPDVGGDGSKVFTLVYHLNDVADLYRNYPAVEGKVYVIGGFTANYLQRGDVILVPIKLGVGWRLGANIGSLCFSKESRWIPVCKEAKRASK
jgi:hypothetical protein